MATSTFAGLEIGRRMLNTFRQVQEITGHNIANASNPDYSRQRADLKATRPYNPGYHEPGLLGTGVEIKKIERLRDVFLDLRRLDIKSSLSNAESISLSVSEMERIIGGADDNVIQKEIDRMLSSLSAVAARPEDLSLRQTALAEAEGMARVIRDIYGRFQKIAFDSDATMVNQVNEVNSLSKNIAAVNVRIANTLAEGHEPNDLLDSRQAMLEKLAGFTGANVSYQANGMVTVSLQGHWLVAQDNYAEIEAVPHPTQPGMSQFQFVSDGTVVTPAAGSMAAQLQIRDVEVPKVLQSLDTLALTMRDDFNALQNSGYGLNQAAPTGIDFFAATSASDLTVNAALLANPRLLAAAANASAAGDGSNMLAMVDLGGTPRPALNDANYIEHLGILVADLGTVNAMAMSREETERIVSNQVQTLTETVSGVNVDEEVTYLMQAQHAYEAGAQYVSTLDRMLDVLVNGLRA